MLLDKGADANAQAPRFDRRSSHYYTEPTEHDDWFAKHLRKGGWPSIEQENYGNVLQLAANQGEDEIVQILLDRGADIETSEKFEAALEAALRRGDNDRIAGVLCGHDRVAGVLKNHKANLEKQSLLEWLLTREAKARRSRLGVEYVPFPPQHYSVEYDYNDTGHGSEQ